MKYKRGTMGRNLKKILSGILLVSMLSVIKMSGMKVKIMRACLLKIQRKKRRKINLNFH